jgi:hypothetical protein
LDPRSIPVNGPAKQSCQFVIRVLESGRSAQGEEVHFNLPFFHFLRNSSWIPTKSTLFMNFSWEYMHNWKWPRFPRKVEWALAGLHWIWPGKKIIVSLADPIKGQVNGLNGRK